MKLFNLIKFIAVKSAALLVRSAEKAEAKADKKFAYEMRAVHAAYDKAADLRQAGAIRHATAQNDKTVTRAAAFEARELAAKLRSIL